MKQFPPLIDKIPVIMLTAIGDETGKSYLTDQGIFQYVVKPANNEFTLRAKVLNSWQNLLYSFLFLKKQRRRNGQKDVGHLYRLFVCKSHDLI